MIITIHQHNIPTIKKALPASKRSIAALQNEKRNKITDKRKKRNDFLKQ